MNKGEQQYKHPYDAYGERSTVCIYVHIYMQYTRFFTDRNGKTEFISPSGPLAGSLCPSSQAPIDQKIKARSAMGQNLWPTSSNFDGENDVMKNWIFGLPNVS